MRRVFERKREKKRTDESENFRSQLGFLREKERKMSRMSRGARSTQALDPFPKKEAWMGEKAPAAAGPGLVCGLLDGDG